MKVTVKNLKKSTVEITITADANAVAPHRAVAVAEISKHVKIDGFRAGHAPEDKIIEKVGEDAVKQEALNRAVQKLYTDAVMAEKLQVVSRPAIDVKSEEPLEFVATVAVMPELTLGDWKKVKLKKEDTKVTDKEYDEFIGQLKKRHAVATPVKDRPAKKGDRVIIDFAGTTPDGVPLENTDSKKYPLELGGGNFIPGFEDGVIGMSIDDEKKIELAFPKDYHAKHLAGKPVHFTVKLHEIDEMGEPELNDDFAKKVKDENATWAQVESDIKDYLGNQKEQAAQQKLEEQLMEELLKITKVEIPEAMLEEEVNHMMGDMKQRMAGGGMKWEDYLANMKKTEEDVMKEMIPEAEKRVTIRMIVSKLMETENTEVTDEELTAALTEAAHRGHHHAPGEECDHKIPALTSPEALQARQQMRVMKLVKNMIDTLTSK